VAPAWWAEIELRVGTFGVGLKMSDLSCGEVSKILTVSAFTVSLSKVEKIYMGAYESSGKWRTS